MGTRRTGPQGVLGTLGWPLSHPEVRRPKLHPERNRPVSNPKTRPWEADCHWGEGGSGSGSDSDSGSRRVQVLLRLLPLQPPHVLLSWSLGQLIRAFLFLEYIQSHPHQGPVLLIPVSRIRFPKTLSGQDCPTLHTSAQSHLLRETSLITRPLLSRCPALAVQ